MATFRRCKICGKEYKYCNTLTPGVFKWQDVACCHEHALEYFRRVEEARSGNSSKAVAEAVSGKVEVEVDAPPSTVDKPYQKRYKSGR